MRLLRLACLAFLAAGCSRDDPPPPEGWRVALEKIPGETLPLRARLPADSVVARRGGVTIIFSAAEVDRYLSRFRRYGYAADASALREHVRGAVREKGWVALAGELPSERALLEFLLAAMLERGRVSVRDDSGALIGGVRRMRVTREWGSGRRFFLPDGTVLLEVTDIVY